MQERMAQEKDQSASKKNDRVPVYENSAQSAKWLWSGVTIVMLIIVGMWGLSMSSLFFDNKQTVDQTEQLLSTSKQDIASIIATFSEREQALPTATSTEDITKEATTSTNAEIAATLKELFASSTTTTSTQEQ